MEKRRFGAFVWGEKRPVGVFTFFGIHVWCFIQISGTNFSVGWLKLINWITNLLWCVHVTSCRQFGSMNSIRQIRVWKLCVNEWIDNCEIPGNHMMSLFGMIIIRRPKCYDQWTERLLKKSQNMCRNINETFIAAKKPSAQRDWWKKEKELRKGNVKGECAMGTTDDKFIQFF